MNNNKYRINFFIENQNTYKNGDVSKLKQLTNILNKDRLVIISGQRHIGKLDFIKHFLNNINIENKYFYFNKSNDSTNQIKDEKDLNNILNNYVQLYKTPRIIIIQDIGKIEGVKNFISKIYKLNYKIIIISNNIKIEGIKEIEILTNKQNNNQINDSLKYGTINEVKLINNIPFKEKYLNLLKNDILLYDIFKEKSVKSIDLYNYTLSYLSQNNLFLSLRDLNTNINDNQTISLKTTIDYIDFSLQSKIIKRVYKYDLKNNNIITSKAKYYFTDNGIRNSFYNFNLNQNTLTENYIFNILECNNFSIYSGINGKFEFSFYGERSGFSDYTNLEKIYIHISQISLKHELQKEINKLLKIGNNYKKYLIINDIQKIGIKKLYFDSVEIIEIGAFIEKFSR